MKIVLSGLHFALFRNFESAVRALASHGHHVHLMADEPETFGGQALAERLAAEFPTVTWSWSPSPVDEPWYPLALKIRFAIDYVRYLAPRYDDVPKLRLRNVNRAPRIVRWLTAAALRPFGAARLVLAGLQWMERKVPVSPRMRACLEEQSPDALLLVSLTVSRSFAMDQFKAARALGIPTAAAIMSWDHLSSKAPLHIAPDVTIVWNDVQKGEAVGMHGLHPDTVVVTGAQCYDEWFDRKPSRSREEFCRRIGLDPSKPFILYVCSTMSPVPTPLEPFFVKEWVEAVRGTHDPSLRAAGILVRPHPERVKDWRGVSLEGIDNLAVHGSTPIDGDAKADYFDSLYYSEAVVGLCTSAFVEAAIIGRPVLTLYLSPYRIHQDGMAHFRYLLNVEGGILHTAAGLPAHLTQLGNAIGTGAARDERNRKFVTAFVRPEGLSTPATPRFVEAVEQLARRGRLTPDSRFAMRSAGTAVVERLAAAGRDGLGRWLLMDAFDEERASRDQATGRAKAELIAQREARREAEQRERETALLRKQALRQQKVEASEARWRTKEERRQARSRVADEERAAKQHAHRRREWRYRLGTAGPVATLKRGLRRLSEVLGH